MTGHTDLWSLTTLNNVDSQTAGVDHVKRPTIRDVAAVAGVSRGTVSRVLNGGSLVSGKAREAVEEAIRSTGYTANHHARSLATGRAGSLAFLLTEPQHLLFDDPTFSRLLRGIAAALTERRMTLVLLVAGSEAEREDVLDYVSAGHVDGVMLVSTHEADPLVDSLVEAKVSTVCCGLPLGHEEVLPSVSVDEQGSARAMVRYLRERGNRRIAMISGPRDTPGGRYRLDGFRQEMGQDFDPRLVGEGDYSVESGVAAMTALLEVVPEGEQGIDAVFAASDRMASGAVAAIHQAGLDVPRHIAVAGFDDAGLAATHTPPLTTMRQPWDEISREMVQLLLAVSAGGAVEQLTLPAELVTRESA